MNALALGLGDVGVAEIFIDKSAALMRITWSAEESQGLSLLTDTIKKSLEMIAHDNPKYVKIISEVN